jgi:hypothetical protein
VESLGLLGILVLWGVLGVLPAWIALIPTRGRALAAMPPAFVAGLGGGALVALLGSDGLLAFWLSLVMASIGGMGATIASLWMQPDARGKRLTPDG